MVVDDNDFEDTDDKKYEDDNDNLLLCGNVSGHKRVWIILYGYNIAGYKIYNLPATVHIYL